MNTLLKSTKIIAPESKFHNHTLDIRIADGNIVKIGADIEPQDNDNTIYLQNLHVSCGWWDSSVCFGEPGFEERETIANGLQTAAKSGFTKIILQPDVYPIPDTGTTINALKAMADGNAVNLYPCGALTVKSKGEGLAEIYDMQNVGAVVFGDYKKPIEDPNLLRIALQYAQGCDAVVSSFPQENKIARNGMVHEHITATKLGLKSIPSLAETLQIARDLSILEYTGGKLHIPTISTAASVKLIQTAKQKGLEVSCSVAIHHLFFTDDVLHEFDSRFKVLPPLRSEEDRKALCDAVKDHTIDYVTTDHRPLNIEHKKTDFDNALYGTIGLETAFGVLNSLFGTEKTVSLLTKDASLFGINRLNLKEGEKACLSLFNPDTSYTFHEHDIVSASKNSAFLDQQLQGKAYGIFNNNQLVI